MRWTDRHEVVSAPDDAALREMYFDHPRAGYRLLDLVTFFTVGEDECRAWTVRRGSLAPQAAGVIHSDFEKGFIKAEVVRFEDLLELGSEAACREKGKLRIEGKGYVVQDGDVMHFRFNV